MRFIIFLTIFLNSPLIQADLLEDSCFDYEGEIVKKYTCPKSKLPLPIRTCVFINKNGNQQFYNGCSGPSGGHKEIFYSSCIQHDLCYHHEPITNRLTQKECDYQLYENLLENCDNRATNIPKCRKWAKYMYRALRLIGKPAFHCSNELSSY